MYILKFSSHFDGAHQLRNYEGKCARIHGHRWDIEAEVTGEKLDKRGLLVDFHDLKAWLKDICESFDHRMINEVAGFRDEELNPTAENLAYFIYKKLHAKVRLEYNDVKLARVTVWESTNCGATYQE